MQVEGEEEVLRKRLIAKEATLRNLTKRYLQFSKAIETCTPEEAETTYQALLKEIAVYEFAVSKARALIDTNTRQVADYEMMQQGIEADMVSTREEIDKLAIQLQEERKLRGQREQYAALARRISAYPPRAKTSEEIEQLEAEIAQLRAEGDAVSGKIELRSKRFAGFMHALHDLQLQLAEETASEAMGDAMPMVE